jgi:hypothetical protein
MSNQGTISLNLDQFDKINLKSWQLASMILMMTGTGLKTFAEMSYEMQEAYTSAMQSLAFDAQDVLSIVATNKSALDNC